eukprot:c56_g1_i2.p1 GENE.c56_g1_i2~~c56_g1_i2.p1  ORF type:complete len:561 (-),score=92.87 c56_g1_i2:229-1860(-)
MDTEFVRSEETEDTGFAQTGANFGSETQLIDEFAQNTPVQHAEHQQPFEPVAADPGAADLGVQDAPTTHNASNDGLQDLGALVQEQEPFRHEIPLEPIAPAEQQQPEAHHHESELEPHHQEPQVEIPHEPQAEVPHEEPRPEAPHHHEPQPEVHPEPEVHHQDPQPEVVSHHEPEPEVHHPEPQPEPQPVVHQPEPQVHHHEPEKLPEPQAPAPKPTPPFQSMLSSSSLDGDQPNPPITTPSSSSSSLNSATQRLRSGSVPSAFYSSEAEAAQDELAYEHAIMSRIKVSTTGKGGYVKPVAQTHISKKLGGAPKCDRCEKSVYKAEEVRALGQIFHAKCLRCIACDASLVPNTVCEHDNKPYCAACHSRSFGPVVYGHANTAGLRFAEQNNTATEPAAASQKKPLEEKPSEESTSPLLGRRSSTGSSHPKVPILDITHSTSRVAPRTDPLLQGANSTKPKVSAFANMFEQKDKEAKEDPSLANLTPRTAAKFKANAAPKCPVCQKSVYKQEEAKWNLNVYHQNCLKCSSCKKVRQFDCFVVNY